MLDEDNSIEFVSGGGTYYRRGGPGGKDGTAVGGAGAVREFLQLIEVLSQKHWAYSGEWRVGLHINGLKGKSNDLLRHTFANNTVTAQITTSPATWDDGVDPVARKLMTDFLRAIGGEKWNLDNIMRQ